MEKLDPAFDTIGGDGVVSISLESGRKINIDKEVENLKDFFNANFQNLKLFVRNGNFCRSFKPSSYDFGYPCWNQKLNIPVHVYPVKNHPFNSLIFTIEIFNVFPMKHEQNEVIGSLILHLYDIIPLNELHDSFYFYQKSKLRKAIGCVSMNIRFMYGTFGYGYSMQINDQLLQAKTENKNILFPRIVPKSYGKDFIYNKDNIDQIIKENHELEEKYSKDIEYLFNFRKPPTEGSSHNSNQPKAIESRKDRLNRLRELVSKDQSETASINLDENFYIRQEQTVMLKRILIQET